MPLSDSIELRAVTFGFAGIPLLGSLYQQYSTCNAVFDFEVHNPNTSATVYKGSYSRTASIDNDRNGYNSGGINGGYDSSVTQDDGWTDHFADVFRNLWGANDFVEVISETEWITHWKVLAPFAYFGEIRGHYRLSNPISVDGIAPRLFSALDDYQLSMTPVPRRAVFFDFLPNARTLVTAPVDIYHDWTKYPNWFYWLRDLPTDGAVAACGCFQSTAHVTFVSNPDVVRFADGEYSLPHNGGRVEPLSVNYLVVAKKSKTWNASLMCQIQHLAQAEPEIQIDESCGPIGRTAEENALGVFIDRPPLTETSFFYRGLSSSVRRRNIFYNDPFFQTDRPPCCAFPPT